MGVFWVTTLINGIMSFLGGLLDTPAPDGQSRQDGEGLVNVPQASVQPREKCDDPDPVGTIMRILA